MGQTTVLGKHLGIQLVLQSYGIYSFNLHAAVKQTKWDEYAIRRSEKAELYVGCASSGIFFISSHCVHSCVQFETAMCCQHALTSILLSYRLFIKCIFLVCICCNIDARGVALETT